jgi:hypothetical protein
MGLDCTFGRVGHRKSKKKQISSFEVNGEVSKYGREE